MPLCALLFSILVLPMLTRCYTKVGYLRSRRCKTHFGVCPRFPTNMTLFMLPRDMMLSFSYRIIPNLLHFSQPKFAWFLSFSALSNRPVSFAYELEAFLSRSVCTGDQSCPEQSPAPSQRLNYWHICAQLFQLALC